MTNQEAVANFVFACKGEYGVLYNVEGQDDNHVWGSYVPVNNKDATIPFRFRIKDVRSFLKA